MKSRKIKNKYSGLLWIGFMILSLLSTVQTAAAQTYTEGYYEYEVKEEAVIITGYFGTETEITLPEKIAGYPVSEIREGAFIDHSVKTVWLPDTIMKIEKNAFPADAEVKYMTGERPDEEIGKKEENVSATEEKSEILQNKSQIMMENELESNLDEEIKEDISGSVEEIEVPVTDTEDEMISTTDGKALAEEQTETVAEDEKKKTETGISHKTGIFSAIGIIFAIMIGAWFWKKRKR